MQNMHPIVKKQVEIAMNEKLIYDILALGFHKCITVSSSPVYFL